MPNYCFNSATFSHEDPAKLVALADAFKEGNPFMTFMAPPGEEWDYGWCSENWGTKWDVQASDYTEIEDGFFTVCFDSAWSPPIGFYNHLVDEGWSVEATYHEPGCTFAGHYEDGDDYCVEYNFDDPNWAEGINDEEVLSILEGEYENYLMWKEEEEESQKEEALPKNDEEGC